MFRSAPFLVLLTGLIGCVSVPRVTAPVASRNAITRDAIERTGAQTAVDLLTIYMARSPYRPLRGGPTSVTQSQLPMVVIDGTITDVSSLQTMPARDIEELRILNGIEGSWRYGTGAGNGVIEITTRRARARR